MKSPVELNSLLSKFFCYITWFVISLDYTRFWTTCKRGLYVKFFNFFETIAYRFKNYKLNYLNINDNQVYKTRASEDNNIKRFGIRTENCKTIIFLFYVNEWCKLDISLRKAENIKRFKSMLKDFFNLK